jgi:hypothetical protein
MARLWQQGDVLPPEATQSLGRNPSQERVMVVSHSCDLQRMIGPQLAIVSGRPGEANPGIRGGKSIRWLQLSTPSNESIDYDIDTFSFVDASLLDTFIPWEEKHHRGLAMVVGRWIGQKYDRLALPDSVVIALDNSGVNSALEKALKRSHDGILDVRVYLDERTSPPVLTFLVIHDADGRNVATEVCASITARALSKANVLDGHVTLASSHPISEDVLTYAQWRKTRPWRVEYISLRNTPPTSRDQ